MIRQFLFTAALASVAVTAMAGLAKMPSHHPSSAPTQSHINPVALLQRLADEDAERPDSTDQTSQGVPAGIRADSGEQTPPRSPTLLNTLADRSPHQWSF